MSEPLEVGASAFADARLGERARAQQEREATRSAALAELHAARDRFVEHAAGLYLGGARAAQSDCDGLEEIADQILAAARALEPLLDRLDVARDQALYRGPCSPAAEAAARRRAWLS